MGIPKEAIFGALALATLAGSGGTAAPVIAAATPAVTGAVTAAVPAATTAAGIGTTALGAEAAGTAIGTGGAAGIFAPMSTPAAAAATASPFAPMSSMALDAAAPVAAQAALPAYSAASPFVNPYQATLADLGVSPTGGAAPDAASLTFDDIQKYMKLAQAGSQVGGALSPGAAPPPPAQRAPIQHQAPNINFNQLMQSIQGSGPQY